MYYGNICILKCFWIISKFLRQIYDQVVLIYHLDYDIYEVKILVNLDFIYISMVQHEFYNLKMELHIVFTEG